MDPYTETFKTWDKVSLLYQEKFMDLELYNETYDFFCNTISKESASIFEVGCGPGNITKYLLSKRPNYTIEGIDISSNMITLAKINNPSASFSVMDCRMIDVIKKKYDGIICGFCLPYLSEVESLKLFSNASNMLNEGGTLYLSFVEGNEVQSGFKTASTGDRTYFNYHNLNTITQFLFSCGFEEPHLLRVNYEIENKISEQHIILIANKKSSS